MIAKLKKINFFILTLSIVTFLLTSLAKGNGDLEKNYNDFVKETRSIRNQLNSLPASNSVEVSVIDSAIKEMDRAVEFAQENFKTNDFEITEKTLNFVDKALADINNSVPKEFINDLTVVDMSKLKDKLSLSDTVIQKSAYIYRKALEKKLVRLADQIIVNHQIKRHIFLKLLLRRS